MNYVMCLTCGVVWVASAAGGLDYDMIGCRCRPGAEPAFIDLPVERGAYLLGLQHAEAAFDAMWADAGWEGQGPSMGFASTLSQEWFELKTRALDDAGRTSVSQNQAAGPPAAAGELDDDNVGDVYGDPINRGA